MQKNFTLDQANYALVFVYGVTKDIQSHMRALLAASGSDNQTQRERRQLELKLAQALRELQLVGCVCRDPQNGVIDFPSQYEGEAVFLNWQLGEEVVSYWHHATEPHSTRHEIDEAFRQAQGRCDNIEFQGSTR